MSTYELISECRIHISTVLQACDCLGYEFT